jgi:imidazolonepropionase-like amidohydrolase
MIRHLFQHRALPLIGLVLLLAGCKPPESESGPPAVTSVVGAVLLDGTGGPPVSNCVVTIESGRIRAAGSRTNLLVPPEADKIDGAGKFLVPALIDVARRAAVQGAAVILRAGDPEAAADQARRNHTPVLASISSLQEARAMLDRGATGFLHMIRDTDAIDPAFIARLRDLQIVFVPMLSQEHNPAELAVAKRNTKRLVDGGVPIAVGSEGDMSREMDMLVEAGLTPAEVLVAATRNGARALGTLAEEGTIEPGKRASLLLLSGNPAEDIRNLRKADRAMADGAWTTRPR